MEICKSLAQFLPLCCLYSRLFFTCLFRGYVRPSFGLSYYHAFLKQTWQTGAFSTFFMASRFHFLWSINHSFTWSNIHLLDHAFIHSFFKHETQLVSFQFLILIAIHRSQSNLFFIIIIGIIFMIMSLTLHFSQAQPIILSAIHCSQSNFIILYYHYWYDFSWLFYFHCISHRLSQSFSVLFIVVSPT